MISMTFITELKVWRSGKETDGHREAPRGQAVPAVPTYRVNPEWARAELDQIAPAQRTRLIEWSADFERVAEWVGAGWRANEPPEQPSVIKFVATVERRTRPCSHNPAIA